MQKDTSHISSDRELVDAVCSGDREAFRLIMERHGAIVMAYLLRNTRNGAVAEDLAQEVFLLAFQHLGRLKKKEALRSWLLGISRNKVREYWRTDGREAQSAQADGKGGIDDAPDASPGPHERASGSEVAETVTGLINEMGPKYQAVLWMRLVEERPFNEISRALSIKESTARMRFQRGAAMLRKALTKKGFGTIGNRG